MTGWNMPDGCSEHDIPGFDGCESYKDRCDKCGCFLRSNADRSQLIENNTFEKQTFVCRHCETENVRYV